MFMEGRNGRSDEGKSAIPSAFMVYACRKWHKTNGKKMEGYKTNIFKQEVSSVENLYSK